MHASRSALLFVGAVCVLGVIASCSAPAESPPGPTSTPGAVATMDELAALAIDSVPFPTGSR